MRAIVLVGGQGTRLRPLTWTTPKQMLPVLGAPMLQRVLAWLHDHGVGDAVLSMGYRADAFEHAWPGRRCAGVALEYAVEPEPLDTGGAIRFAADTAGVDERCVVVNGDNLSEIDVTELVAFHERCGAEATISLHRVADPSAFGVVPIDEAGRVLDFVEKPPPGRAPSDLVNAGVYVLEPSVFERIPPGRRLMIERETFPAMAAEGALFGLPSDAYWSDTGTPERYLHCQLELLDGAGRRDLDLGAVRSDDGVWCRGAAALDGEVVGPAWLDAGVRVEAGATVHRSVLGPGTVVEQGASVTGSVLLAGARVGRDATVDGAIVGHDVTVGPGARLTGLTTVGDGEVVPAGAALDGARVPDRPPAGSPVREEPA